jgi:hypothetical protein
MGSTVSFQLVSPSNVYSPEPQKSNSESASEKNAE